jgi:hypothetical protein
MFKRLNEALARVKSRLEQFSDAVLIAEMGERSFTITRKDGAPLPTEHTEGIPAKLKHFPNEMLKTEMDRRGFVAEYSPASFDSDMSSTAKVRFEASRNLNDTMTRGRLDEVRKAMVDMQQSKDAEGDEDV